MNLQLFLILSLIGFSYSALTAGPAPRLLPFQGVLTDTAGKPVADGTKLIQFRIYDAPVAGQTVWAGEVHRTTVNAGLVNVLLGSRTRLDGVDFDRTLYLEITVDANGDNALTAEDPPLLPRQSLLPVIFAKEAADSRLLGGHDWSGLIDNANPTTGTIRPGRIQDGSLTTAKIGEGSVTGSKIAPLTITAANIAPATITSGQIASGTIDMVLLAQQVAEALNPPGTIVAFGGENIPSGWMLCDGTPLSSRQYRRLYSAISTNWGGGYTDAVKLGDFNLPDLRGMFLRGVTGTRNGPDFIDPDAALRVNTVVGGNAGNAVGSAQMDMFRSHTHSYNPKVNNYADGRGGGGATPGSDSTRDTSPAGGNESRPKNVYVNYIIKY